MKLITFKFKEKMVLNDNIFELNEEIKIKIYKNRTLNSYLNEFLGMIDCDFKIIKFKYNENKFELNTIVKKPINIDVFKNKINKQDDKSFIDLNQFSYFYDCTIKVKDKEFKAHKCILAARSDYFKSKNLGALITIDNINLDDFNIIFNWIYYSQIKFKNEIKDLFKIINLANIFKINLLIKECENELLNILNENNFKEILLKTYESLQILTKNFIENIINFLLDNPETLVTKFNNFESEIFSKKGWATLILETISKKKSKKKRVSFVSKDSSKDEYF